MYHVYRCSSNVLSEFIALTNNLKDNTKCLDWFKTVVCSYIFCNIQNKTLNCPNASLTYPCSWSYIFLFFFLNREHKFVIKWDGLIVYQIFLWSVVSVLNIQQTSLFVHTLHLTLLCYLCNDSDAILCLVLINIYLMHLSWVPIFVQFINHSTRFKLYMPKIFFRKISSSTKSKVYFYKVLFLAFSESN